MAEDDDRASPFADSGGAFLAATLGTVSDNPRVDRLLERQVELSEIQIDALRKQDEFELSHLRWRRFNDQMKGALQIMAVALGLLVVIGIGAAMWNASEADGIVVDSFSVPPAYAQAGIPGDVVADDMTAKIAAVRDFANDHSLAHSNDVSEDRSRDVKVEIPETGVSLAEAWRYLKLWLGNERHLTGNIRTLPDGNIALTASLSGAGSFTFTGKPAGLDALEQKAAEQVFATVDPVNIVLYLFGKGRIDEALVAAAHHVAIAQGTRELAGAYSLQGNMTRGATGDARRSLAIVHLAIALDPKAAPQRMEAIGAARTLGHDEEVLAQARVIATLHPEDNIASWRTSNGFAYVQEIGARWRTAFAGDFAALAILPCVYACSRADASAIHAEGLARQHDVAAARARLEEAATAGQPDPGDVARAHYDIDTARSDWRAVGVDARDYADAVATYRERKLLAQTRVMPLLARALAAQGDVDGAQKALVATPLDCYDCVLARGDVAASRHDWHSADAWYARAVHLAPSIPFAYANWGATLRRRGDLDGAIAQFDLAHQKGPHFADPLEMWGEALVAKNRSDLAISKFEEAARHAPNWGRLHLKWGEALLWLGRKDDAAKQFATAAGLDLSPTDRTELARMNLGGRS
jgi:tetratricopeptide (TPR) repeat protein